MRRTLFILAMIVLLAYPLSAQTVQLVLQEPGVIDTMVVSPVHIDSVLSQRLATYTGKGYWDARIEVNETEADQINARLLPGDISELGHIHFKGISARDSRYLEKEFEMGQATISAAKLKLAQGRLQGLGYQLSEASQLSIDQEQDYHLTHVVTTFPEIRMEGLASFNQTATADTIAWYGNVRVNIPNFDGKGKSFDFQWERLKENSESFDLGIAYPWIFQLPLKGIFNFGREVIDGNYQVIQTVLGLSWDIDWQRSIYFNYERNESFITHAGALLYPEWRADKKQLLGLGYRQSGLNTQLHQGFALKTTLFQEMNFEPEAIRKFILRSEAEKRFPWGFYFSQRGLATIQNHTVAINDPSIPMALGGVNSIRGYEEAAIRAPNIVSFQNTLHYEIGNQSQLLIFYDIGLHNTETSVENMQGYGAGIQLRSGRGPIRLILASHKGLKLSNSFFHIEYSGGLPWIDR